MADLKSMANLKENVNPATCTTTLKQVKRNKLKTTPRRNTSGLPFNPKDDNQIIEIKEGQDVIEIKENKQHIPKTDQDTELVTESDVANAVIDIMNINKLPSGMEQLAADLDDIDYVTTRRQKRKLDNEGENEENQPPKKTTHIISIKW